MRRPPRSGQQARRGGLLIGNFIDAGIGRAVLIAAIRDVEIVRQDVRLGIVVEVADIASATLLRAVEPRIITPIPCRPAAVDVQVESGAGRAGT